jgi:hypothetical protein
VDPLGALLESPAFTGRRGFLVLRGVERGDIGLHTEIFAGRLARPLDDHTVIAVRLLQNPF